MLTEPIGISEYRNSCFPTVLLLRFLIKKKKVSCGLHFLEKINKETNAHTMVWGLLHGDEGGRSHLALPLWMEKEAVTLGLHRSVLGDLPFLCPLPFRGVLVWVVCIPSIPRSFWWADLHGGPRSREVWEGIGLAWKRQSGHRGWFRTAGDRTGLGGTGCLKNIST